MTQRFHHKKEESHRGRTVPLAVSFAAYPRAAFLLTSLLIGSIHQKAEKTLKKSNFGYIALRFLPNLHRWTAQVAA